MQPPVNPEIGEVSRLLDRAAEGDEAAAIQLWDAANAELRRLAAALVMGERPSADLQPTIVVNEAFIRMNDTDDVPRWQDRGHFFGYAWRVMRQLLIDHARARRAVKRGGGWRRMTLEVAAGELVTLDHLEDDGGRLVDALDRLAAIDPRQHEVVWRRFALGQTVEVVAESIGVSPRTVAEDWRIASAWLRRELARDDEAVHDG